MERFFIELSANEEELVNLIEPYINGEGFELVKIKIRTTRGKSVISLYVDTLDKENGITISQIEDLSRYLLDVLEAKAENSKILLGQYNLEVSSPGLDRPLCKKSHFEKLIGSKIKLKLKVAQANLGRTIVGILLEVLEDGILVNDGVSNKVLFNDILEANSIFVFESKSKKGKKD